MEPAGTSNETARPARAPAQPPPAVLSRTLTLAIHPQSVTSGPDPRKAVLAAVNYLRVSTQDQGRKGYSLPEQQVLCLDKARELAQDFADQQHCEVELHVAEHVDTVGGDFRNRPQLLEAVAFLGRARAQWWICLDPDRLSRKLRIQLELAEEIEAAGAELAFVYYNHEDTPEGWAFFQVRGVFAELDKKKILRRTRAGAQRKLRERRQLAFGIRMWGYRFDRGTDSLVVDSLGDDGLPAPGSPAHWVLKWKEWAGRDGLSPEAVSQRHYALTGRYVARQTIRTVLERDCYATGQYVVNRRDWTGYQAVMTLNRQLSAGARHRAPRPRPKPESEHVAVPVPAFVPPELQQAVAETLRRAARRTPRNGQVRLLQGLGRCGLCSGNLYYGPSGYSGLMMTCSRRTPQTRKLHPDDPRYRPACALPAKRAAAVEDAVWGQVAAAILNPDVLFQEAGAMARSAGPDPAALRAELVQVADRLAAVSDQRMRCGLLYARGIWTLDDVERAAADLTGQTRLLEQQRQELQHRICRLESALPSPRQDMATAAELRVCGAETLANLPPARRRDFILDTVDHFILAPTPRGAPPEVRIGWR